LQATKKPTIETKKEKVKIQDHIFTANEHLNEDRALIADAGY